MKRGLKFLNIPGLSDEVTRHLCLIGLMTISIPLLLIAGCTWGVETDVAVVGASVAAEKSDVSLVLTEGQVVPLPGNWTLTFEGAHHKHGVGFATGTWRALLVSPTGIEQSLQLNSDTLPTERKIGSRYLRFEVGDDTTKLGVTHGPMLAVEPNATTALAVLAFPETCGEPANVDVEDD